MTYEKEMTAPVASVGTDAEQSSQIFPANSIPDNYQEFNSFDEFFRQQQKELLRQMNPSYLKTVTMAELYDTVFESQTPLIDGLLNRGAYLFVGSPKVGKSFMMLQLVYHISIGKPLWDYKVRQAPVLYFALEDNYARLQRRLYKMFGTEETSKLYLATEGKTVNGGLDEQIRGFMQEHHDTGLIIIDTLKRVRESGGGEYSYSNDYDIVAHLKAIADSYKISILIVHHTRKEKGEDIFDSISGTNGLLGAADGAFLLSKNKRTANEAIMDVTGRDQQDMRLHLSKDTQHLVWNLEQAETELWIEPPEPLLEKISEICFTESDAWNGTATELCEKLRIDMKPNVLTMRLNVNAGRLLKEYNIKYESRRSHDGRKVSLIKQTA
ncbi:MAG: AAA family ATPase [Christensenella sp.]